MTERTTIPIKAQRVKSGTDAPPPSVSDRLDVIAGAVEAALDPQAAQSAKATALQRIRALINDRMAKQEVKGG